MVAEIKTGGVDLIRNVSADIVPELKTHPHGLHLLDARSCASTTSSSTCASAPFDKKAVRQAANYAIDKQTIIQKLMAGLGTPGRDRGAAARLRLRSRQCKPYPFDQKKAKELLAQAGYPERCGHHAAQRVRREPPVSSRPSAEMLTEVGIRATPKMWDPGPAWNKFFQADGKATHGIYGTWGNYSVFDADAVLHPLYHTEPGGWIRQVVHARGRTRQADRRGPVHAWISRGGSGPTRRSSR